MVKKQAIRYFYFLSVYLVMATVFGLSFTWGFPAGLALTIGVVSSVWFMSTYGKSLNRKNTKCVVLLILWFVFLIVSHGGNYVLQVFVSLFNLIIAYSIIVLNIRDKYLLLKVITRITSVILCISLVAWILFLLGVPLPHTAEFLHTDNFHSYINYYFFVMSPRDFLILPRFMSVFKEPGHMASICVLLILANLKLEKRSMFDIVVLSVSLIISFSLAGWAVMAISLLIMSSFEGRYKIKKIVGVVILLTLLFIQFGSNQDSVVYEYIFQRLEYDEQTGIAGNNRTTDYFESKYTKFKESSDVWFGISSQLSEDDNWTTGNSGWKVTIVNNGYFGFLLLHLILITYFYNYRCKHGFIFLIAYLILCYIRSYFVNPYWFYIFLLALPVFIHKTPLPQSSNQIKTLYKE